MKKKIFAGVVCCLGFIFMFMVFIQVKALTFKDTLDISEGQTVTGKEHKFEVDYAKQLNHSIDFQPVDLGTGSVDLTVTLQRKGLFVFSNKATKVTNIAQLYNHHVVHMGTFENGTFRYVFKVDTGAGNRGRYSGNIELFGV